MKIEAIRLVEQLVHTYKVDRSLYENREALASRQRRVCPIDAQEMESLDIEGVLIEYCSQCRGLWFDGGELRQLLSLEEDLLQGSFQFFAQVDALVPIKKRLIPLICPTCQQQLQSLWNDKSQVTIDYCSACAGVWLDAGEFATLFFDYQAGEPRKTVLPATLGAYFDYCV